MHHAQFFEGHRAILFFIRYFAETILFRTHRNSYGDPSEVLSALRRVGQSTDENIWEAIESFAVAVQSYLSALGEKSPKIEIGYQAGRTSLEWTGHMTTGRFLELRIVNSGVLLFFAYGEHFGVPLTSSKFLRFPELLDSANWEASEKEWALLYQQHEDMLRAIDSLMVD